MSHARSDPFVTNYISNDLSYVQNTIAYLVSSVPKSQLKGLHLPLGQGMLGKDGFRLHVHK